MNEYPDSWVILKINHDGNILYKVLASFYGGYGGSDSWRLNSGITKVVDDEDKWLFYGVSGSCYVCSKHPRAYSTNTIAEQTFRRLVERFGDTVTKMPYETDWSMIV